VTTLVDNLREWKLQLAQRLKHGVGAEERGQIEGELMKIEIALSLLDDLGKETPGEPTMSK